MTVELEEARVKVAQFQKQCEEYLVVIVQQKMDADEQQKACSIICIWRTYMFLNACWLQNVAARSEKIAEEETKCLAMAENAQHDLDEALPALQEAVKVWACFLMYH